MEEALLYDDEAIANGNIHEEPEEVLPPLLAFSASCLFVPQLVRVVHAIHVFVVEVHNCRTVHHQERPIPLLSHDRILDATIAFSMSVVRPTPLIRGEACSDHSMCRLGTLLKRSI
jgi:hypothetical protein